MNPVKIVAGGSAGSVAALIAVYVASRLGVSLTADDGAVIAAAASAVCAFVAHNGLVGIAHMIWAGEQKNGSAPETAVPAHVPIVANSPVIDNGTPAG